LNIVNNEVKYKADVRLEFGEIPEIDCIPSQINQVILNLIVNADQATRPDTRGVITIKTYTQPDLSYGEAPNAQPTTPDSAQEPSLSPAQTSPADQYVVVEVRDLGMGISPENLSKIFDPFFTTKKVGVGTGLGLSVSHGIIQRHAGQISVSSVINEGTCFKLVLPVHQANPS
jgi:signal transduction histidine kinase